MSPDVTTQIALNKDLVATVDVIDSDLNRFKWFCLANKNRRARYARRSTGEGMPPGRTRAILMHRVILERMLVRALGKGEQVDHIDGNGLNNQRSNLRLVSNAQNNANKGKNKNNTSGYKGVSWNKRKQRWRADIKVNRKQIHLGYFDSAEEAHEAYKRATVEINGEFARFE